MFNEHCSSLKQTISKFTYGYLNLWIVFRTEFCICYKKNSTIKGLDSKKFKKNKFGNKVKSKVHLVNSYLVPNYATSKTPKLPFFFFLKNDKQTLINN